MFTGIVEARGTVEELEPKGTVTRVVIATDLPVEELPLGARISLSEGEQARIWVLDVDGSRLVVLLQDQDLTATQRAEAQAILASLHIEPAN